MALLGAPECPVCASEEQPGARACPRCGFPYSLRGEAVRGLAEADDDGHAPGRTTAGPAAHAPPPSAPRDSDEVERLANELERVAVLYNRLGGHSIDPTRDLREAIFLEMDERSEEARATLRAAIDRASPGILEEVGRGIKDLEKARSAVRSEGLEPAYEKEAERIRAASDGRRWTEACDLLLSALADLRALREAAGSLATDLARSRELLDAAKLVALDLADLERARAAIDARRTEGAFTRSAAEGLLREAEANVEAVRGRLAARLAEEVERTGGLLERFPEGLEAAAAPRAFHTEALDRLNRRQLPEAAHSLQRLAKALPALGEPPKNAPKRPVRRLEGPATKKQIDSLVRRARTLAERVRALPAGSPLAAEASSRIREATALLKKGDLPAAEGALDLLMEALDRSTAATGSARR